jgi:hypothetical protein
LPLPRKVSFRGGQRRPFGAGGQRKGEREQKKIAPKGDLSGQRKKYRQREKRKNIDKEGRRQKPKKLSTRFLNTR